MFETTNQKFIGISCERNHVYLVGGWALAYPSEKYDFVSWDDDIPKIWKIKKMFQTTNQLACWTTKKAALVLYVLSSTEIK